ncbi:MAG TPA: cyclopropane-fatty-acyl-phospholipid synthase family protein [Alphaproteobacteria bacterium]|nr:cyclopropane-fatty-acyl-phospholipid synthase family protein [Alphaproteobacteria bacterium]
MTIETPDGRCYSFAGANPGANAQMQLHRWDVITAMARRGDAGLAESYSYGGWDSPDPAALFLFGLQNQESLNDYIYGSMLGRLAARAAYFFNRNTISGSRKNIVSHYDLGNNFYALWLDPTMTYSSAIFANENEPLAQAQHNKYDRILDRLQPSGSLLEIGCGWGGFAERAVERGDYRIKGLTISDAQHEFASARLGQKAQIALEDYRTQSGKYDQLVSIEMFEAVGEKFWPVYFEKVKSLLADKGRAMIQTITIADEWFESYRRGGDAIRTYIFPGGMLPSPERFQAAAQQAGLRVADRYAFGQDYARTLSHWLDNFEARLGDVRALGFDEKFIRMWRFYLTCCIAAFRHGRTDVMQWELQHAA